jgi:methylase of polypeptide subunit release factors
MGSGSVGVAALRSGRRFIGTDLNPDAVRWSAQRLRQFGAGRQPDDLPPLGRPDLLELIGSQT